MSQQEAAQHDAPQQEAAQREAGRQEGDEPICSAKACREPAVWVLVWNNPKLHTPDRRKTWLACEDHREHLSKFLGVRGFLKDVVELSRWAEQQPPA
jgi:hypothetical protein